MKGDRRDACPTCLGRASGLEAGEPAVEGEGFGGVEECGERLGRALDSGGGAWTRKWDGVEEPAELQRLRC